MSVLISGRVKVNKDGKLEKPVFALTEAGLNKVISSLKDTGWVMKKNNFRNGPYICCVMEFKGRK